MHEYGEEQHQFTTPGHALAAGFAAGMLLDADWPDGVKVEVVTRNGMHTPIVEVEHVAVGRFFLRILPDDGTYDDWRETP